MDARRFDRFPRAESTDQALHARSMYRGIALLATATAEMSVAVAGGWKEEKEE